MRMSFIAALFIVISAGSIWAEQPVTTPGDAITTVARVMTYQGILKDATGEPVGDGEYNLIFRLYADESAIDPLWVSAPTVVQTSGGFFVTELGSVDLPFDNTYYLSVQVQGDAEMAQRQRLTAGAYALRSDTADVAISAVYSINSDQVDGQHASDFAPISHDHDVVYVNEGQGDAVTSGMIANGEVGLNDLADNSVTGNKIINSSIVDEDIAPEAAIAASKINDGSGSGLDADLFDGLNSSDFLSTASDYGRSGVATDLYEGSQTLTDKYVNRDGPDSVVTTSPYYPAFKAKGVTGLYASGYSTSDWEEPTGVYARGEFDGHEVGVVYGIFAYAKSTASFAEGTRGGVFTVDPASAGENVGVFGSASGGTGVYGYGGTYGVYYSGGLAGSGPKSCVVKTSQGPTLLYCQESPENLFEDFGNGQLNQGQAHIELDPLFLETVTIDQANPLKVFIQVEGECNGVYVVKGTTGFDVIELDKGTGDTPFSYRVVAKRKGFEDRRLDYTETGLNDPYLYPEAAAKMQEEQRRMQERMEGNISNPSTPLRKEGK